MVALEQLILDGTQGLTIGEPINSTYNVEYCEGNGSITRQESRYFVPVFNQGQQFIIDVPMISPKHKAVDRYRRYGLYKLALQITPCNPTCKQLYDYIRTLEMWLETVQVKVNVEQPSTHVTKAWRPAQRWKNDPLWIAQTIDIIIPTDEAGRVTVPVTHNRVPFQGCARSETDSQDIEELLDRLDEADSVTTPINHDHVPHQGCAKPTSDGPCLEDILAKSFYLSCSLYIKGFWICYGCRGLTISLARLDTALQPFPLERPIYNLKAIKQAYGSFKTEITDAAQPVEIEI